MQDCLRAGSSGPQRAQSMSQENVNRFHSGPTQRQQARWLVVGFGVTTALMVTTIGAGSIWHPDPPARAALLPHVFGEGVGQVGFIPIPLAIAVAITRIAGERTGAAAPSRG